MESYTRSIKIDKRLAHLSSLINSEQITRKEALEILKEPLYEENNLKFDKSYIAKKLEISVSELDKLISDKSQKHTFYKNYSSYYNFLKNIQSFLTRKFNARLDKYS